MRSRDRLVLGLLGVVAALALAAAARAQASPAASPAPTASVAPASAAPAASDADAATHDALRALRKRIVDAFNARNVDALVAEAHPDIVFTTMNNDVVHGPDGVKAYFNKMMVGPDRMVDDITIDFQPDALTALYGDTGISYGWSEGQYALHGGGKFFVRARWTATLLKHEGAWKVAAFHYSTNVFNNAILDGVKRFAFLAIVVAGVLGLVVGVLLGRRFRAA
jgi:ketosteroid isomerase-like protein